MGASAKIPLAGQVLKSVLINLSLPDFKDVQPLLANHLKKTNHARRHHSQYTYC